MLVVLLALVVYSVKLDISIIPAMMIAIVWSMAIAYRCGYRWNDIMGPVYEREKGVVEVFLIILLIGAFVASMIFSGTIPTIIYYLIKIINPTLMVVLSFLITAIVSVIIGTSWGNCRYSWCDHVGNCTEYGRTASISSRCSCVWFPCWTALLSNGGYF